MQPKIVTIPDKKLVGMNKKMSYANNTTGLLWQSFMPLKKHISNAVGTDLYSLQIYPSLFTFSNFNPNEEFIKWAAIEVSNFETLPGKLQSYDLKGGLYAAFIHKGSVADFHKTFSKIFIEWLPNSDYEIDNREHFELLGEKYSNTDPNSEEEIWVPIALKK